MIQKYLFALLAILISVGLVAGIENSKETKADAKYVGQQTCMTSNCHEKSYGANSSYKGVEEFMKTSHQKIHQRPSPTTVRNERDFVNKKKVVVPYLAANNENVEFRFDKIGNDYFIGFKLLKSGDSTEMMKIEYTYGGMGWMQRFLVKINEQYYYLPFQFSAEDYMQYTDTNRYYVIDLNKWSVADSTGKLRLLKYNSQTFKNFTYNRTCVFCHVNGFDFKMDINGTDTTYKGTWFGRDGGDMKIQDLNMSIGCESCHGPGSDHVANPVKGNILNPNTWAATPERTDRKLDLCGQCHTRMGGKGTLSFTYPYVDSIKKFFKPGDTLANYVKTPTAGARYNCDGIHSYAHHQTVQDYRHSGMYKAHALKNGCWDCHNVHSNGTNGMPFQLNSNFYSLKVGEGCMQCHGDKAATMTNDKGLVVNKHTQHSIEASACVNCHFTKGVVMRFTNGRDFSNHTFKVIRPEVTKNFLNCITPPGMPNTCALGCHLNGRGNRNSKPTDKVAPDYGIQDPNPFDFRDKEDIDLADSLTKGFAKLYPQYIKSVLEDKNSEATRINAINPNPATNFANINFELKNKGEIRLEIATIDGQVIKLLSFGEHEKGKYNANWDLADDLGSVVPSGVYIVTLKAGKNISSKKLIVMNNK